MSEVIAIHIGGAGSKIGVEFWQQMGSEYENQESKKLPSNFYHEDLQGKMQPRAIFIDQDTKTEKVIKGSTVNFNKNNNALHQSPTQNLWGEGKYQGGSVLVNQMVMDILHKQVEKCDRLSGFVMSSASSGGTSGTASLFTSKMREEYPAYMLQVFNVYPGYEESPTKMDYSPLGIYNTVFNIHSLIEETDTVNVFENKAVSHILKRSDSLNFGYPEINNYLGRCMSEHCVPYRQSGPLNTNQRKRATNLILFPRLKFLRGCLSSKKDRGYMESAMDFNLQLMSGIGKNDPRVFTVGVNVRDPFAYESEIDTKVRSCEKALNNTMCEWVPCNIHASITDLVDPAWGPSAWVIHNGNNNILWTKPVAEAFTAQFRRKAFIHRYIGLGMDQMEFTEAQSNMNDLISEYTPCCYGMQMDEDDYDEEDY